MNKKKVTIEDLRIKSYVTELDEEQLGHVRGGYYVIVGRRYSYRTRWTSVDTRSEGEMSPIGNPKNQL